MGEESFVVHPTAIIEDGAVVGAGTRIWHHAHVREGARVGANCTVGKGAFVDTGVVVGDGSKVQNHACIYAGAELGDEVFVGPGAVITNDRYPRATSPGWTPLTTRVRHGASIGANATVIAGIVIDRWATVAAGAVVTRDVAAHELVAGNPARRIGWVCECGRVVQHGADAFAGGTCEACGRAHARPEQGSIR